MCVTICGRFRTDEGVVVGYDNRIWAKDTTNWGVQIAGMIFQTRSRKEIPETDLLRLNPGIRQKAPACLPAPLRFFCQLNPINLPSSS